MRHNLDISSIPPLLARLALGIRFLAAGLGKLSFYLWHYDDLVQRAANAGITEIATRFGTPLLSSIELIASLALIIGTCTRAAALTLCGVLGLYTLIDVLHRGSLLGRAEAFDLSIYLLLLFWIAVAGPGKYRAGQRDANASKP